jgi:hypothetical protein
MSATVNRVCEVVLLRADDAVSLHLRDQTTKNAHPGQGSRFVARLRPAPCQCLHNFRVLSLALPACRGGMMSYDRGSID